MIKVEDEKTIERVKHEAIVRDGEADLIEAKADYFQEKSDALNRPDVQIWLMYQHAAELRLKSHMGGIILPY